MLRTRGNSEIPIRPCDYLSTHWMVQLLTPGDRYRPL